jgi:hypothetical protein
MKTKPEGHEFMSYEEIKSEESLPDRFYVKTDKAIGQLTRDREYWSWDGWHKETRYAKYVKNSIGLGAKTRTEI